MTPLFVDNLSKLARLSSIRGGSRLAILGFASLVAYAAPARAQVAQQGAPAVVIRGQVPIPQIVTIRPREVPKYNLENILLPSRDFSAQLERGYAVMPSREVTGLSYANVIESLPMRLDSLGAPPLPHLPPIELTPFPVRYTTVKRQRAWCAPNWWCPKHKVQEAIVADFPANFPRR